MHAVSSKVGPTVAEISTQCTSPSSPHSKLGNCNGVVAGMSPFSTRFKNTHCCREEQIGKWQNSTFLKEVQAGGGGGESLQKNN